MKSRPRTGLSRHIIFLMCAMFQKGAQESAALGLPGPVLSGSTNARSGERPQDRVDLKS